MSKIFAVTISYTTMIRAENAEDAVRVASSAARDIVGDTSKPDDVAVHREITSAKQLTQFGWDGTCLPYGGDGNTTLGEYLRG